MKKEKMKDIADELLMGMRCFVHLTTREIKSIPDENDYSESETEAWAADIKEIKKNSKKYLEVKKMDSRNSFAVMREFVDAVDNRRIKERLLDALEKPKPFHHFKTSIDNSGNYRQQWFEFRDRKWIEWVEKQLHEKDL